MKPLYCDNHLLVLEKPAGTATQPDFHEQAKQYVKKAFQKPGEVFLHPIHRLDKPVGGIVLFARTSKALTRLNESMRKQEFRKFYLAKVEGQLPKKGTLEHCLVHGDFFAYVDPQGKKALLHYRLLEQDPKSSLVEVELVTGRYHQIRAQFSAIGHPVVGDAKYGSKTCLAHISLYHYKMVIIHPITKLEFTVQSQVVCSF